MSDLVERLRDGWMSRRLNEEAADRIEAAEALLRGLREDLRGIAANAEEAGNALESIGVVSGKTDSCAEFASAALAKIDTFLNGGAKS